MKVERLVAVAVRCTRCGAGLDRCRCWVRLQCKTCHAEARVERTPDDGDADVIVTRCPDCVAKDRRSTA